MSETTIQDSVAVKSRHFTRYLKSWRRYFPDGTIRQMAIRIGSIGEALATSYYNLELFTASEETHDAKAPDGRLVQIKATQINRVSLSSEPEWLLVLKIHKDGTFQRNTTGPASWSGSIAETAEKRSAPHLSGKTAGSSSNGPAG